MRIEQQTEALKKQTPFRTQIKKTTFSNKNNNRQTHNRQVTTLDTTEKIRTAILN